MCSGACTTTRFRGQTAAELAQESGYPAIARFIQMNHGKPSSDADSRSTDYGSIDSVTLPPETPGPLLLAASPAGAPPRAQRHLDAQQRLMAEGQRHMEKLQALQVLSHAVASPVVCFLCACCASALRWQLAGIGVTTDRGVITSAAAPAWPFVWACTPRLGSCSAPSALCAHLRWQRFALLSSPAVGPRLR